MDLQEKIESRIEQLNAEIEARKSEVITLANNKEFFDIPAIIKHCEGLNILFNQLVQLQELAGSQMERYCSVDPNGSVKSFVIIK